MFYQADELQALLEVPAEGGLAARSAEQVARGLGSAQASARQSLPGIRPLGHTPSVSLFLLILAYFTSFNKFFIF
jgi:hypothetical protein